VYLVGAKKGVLVGKDEDHDGNVEIIQHKPTTDEKELAAWVSRVLPDLAQTGQETRLKLLCRALKSNELTLPRLTKASRLPGGFRVLVDMLEVYEIIFSVEI
jgi:hypothetical protein